MTSRADGRRVALLVLGFGVALGLRVVVGGDDVAGSQPAGLLFAGCLLLLALAAGTRVPVSRWALLLGVAGLLLVIAPVAVETVTSLRPLRGTQGFATWAAVVTVVAGAEEVFLRGSLYDATERWGPWCAIGLGAVLFALLHVPLYGWHVVPLDLAVGIVLGGLRQSAGTSFAPAVTHVGADWVGWFVS